MQFGMQPMSGKAIAVHHKPMKDEIFQILHERVISGGYAAGEWLRQEEIATQLGVSMTPVREALDLLVSAGLAERIPYRGVRILQPAAEEIADAYMLRLLLECTAAHAAALHASEGQLGKLEDILEQSRPLVQLKDMSRERFLSRELHESIVAAAGNALLHKMYLTVLNLFPDWMLYEYMYRHPELLDQSMQEEYREHQAIVAALCAHDPQLAMQRTLEHILHRGRELETYLNVPAELIREREAQVLPLLGEGLKS